METVQSYLQAEVLNLVIEPEALDKWHGMIKEMGLEGQGQITEPDKSPIPYLFMTPSMVATFETLCPREVKLKDYKAGPIPLQALEHIRLAQREGHFLRIMIRYDDKAPDPVAIGETGHFYTYGTNGKIDGVTDWQRIPDDKLDAVKAAGHGLSVQVDQRFLLARWGAENDTLENLALKAKERHMREKGAELNKAIKEATSALNTLNEEATLKYNC